MADRPLLDGIRVVCIAEQYPGPYATLLLADLGADVIIVERPGVGDPTRHSAPDFHEALARNKRSVALDLKHPLGRDAFLRLAADADVVLEGFRPGVVDRLGIGDEAVRAVNPDVVYLSISGFGQTGPLRDRPAHDLSYQAQAGILRDRIDAADVGGASPIALGDLSAGTFAAFAAVAGLVARDRDGTGTYVDVSMTDGLVSWLTPFLFAAANGLPPIGMPPKEPAYGLFRLADGTVLTLSVAFEDWFWVPLCEALALPELAPLDRSAREARHDELRDALATALSTRVLADLEPAFDAAGVPFGAVLSFEEVLDHEHTAARGLLVDVPAAGDRPARTHVRQPLTVRGAAAPALRHAPTIGEHTVEVLRAAGFAADEVTALLEAGAAAASVATPPG